VYTLVYGTITDTYVSSNPLGQSESYDALVKKNRICDKRASSTAPLMAGCSTVSPAQYIGCHHAIVYCAAARCRFEIDS
jgi:hypothetical protein